MFNVGGGELIVIALLALIVLGPNRLPGAARQVGKVVADLRRISSGFQDEVRTAFEEAGRDPAPASPEPTPVATPHLDAAISAVSAQAPAKATATTRAPAKKAPARKAAAKQAATKQAATKQAPAKKAPAKQAATKKAPAKQAATKKAPAKPAAGTTAAGTRSPASQRATSKATPAKRAAPVSKAPRRRSPS